MMKIFPKIIGGLSVLLVLIGLFSKKEAGVDGVYTHLSMPPKFNLRVIVSNGTFEIMADDLGFKGYSTNKVGGRGTYVIGEKIKEFDARELVVRYQAGYGEYRDSKPGDANLEKNGYISSSGTLCLDRRDLEYFKRVGSPERPNSSSDSGKKDDEDSGPEDVISKHVKKRFGSDCKVDIQGGFSGGSYQVQVYIPVTKPEFAGQMKTPDGNYGYDRKNFMLLLNDSKTKVKSMDRY